MRVAYVGGIAVSTNIIANCIKQQLRGHAILEWKEGGNGGSSFEDVPNYEENNSLILLAEVS